LKAIVITENGGSEKVTFTEVDASDPGPGQLRVAVETAGVNYLDIYQREGAVAAPFVAGVEGVGRVTEVGSDVDADWGVGRLLTQIAHHLGATVIGTASTAEKRRIAVDNGADHAIDYANFAAAVADITEGRGVDVVYDGVGRDTVEDGLKSLAVRGILVVIGAASGPPPAIEFPTLAARSLSVMRPSVAHFTARPGELAWRAEEVFGWARQGVITTAIAARYPLKDTAQAQKDLTSRRLAGKLLIQVAPQS
jgi:NADPH2:quinone reductase